VRKELEAEKVAALHELLVHQSRTHHLDRRLRGVGLSCRAGDTAAQWCLAFRSLKRLFDLSRRSDRGFDTLRSIVPTSLDRSLLSFSN